MNATKDEAYEDMAATFQLFMMHWLNDALEQAGIEDIAKRKSVIHKFCFTFSIWKDQYWFEDSSHKRIFPCIAFAENGPASDTDIENLGTLFLPSEGFSFRDYVGGNMKYYFDDLSENISELSSGVDE